MIAKKKFFGPQLWPQKLQLSWWLGKNKPFMFTALTKKTDFFRWLQKKFFGASVLATEIPSFLMIGKNQTFYVHGLTKKPDFSWWLQKKKVFWGLSFGHRNFNFLGDWEKLKVLCSRLWQRKLTFLDDCKKKVFWATTLATEISTFLMIGKNQTFYVHGFDFSWWLQKKRFFGASVLATEISTLQVWNSKASMERTIGLLCCLCFLLPSQTSCGPKNFFFWQSSRKVSFLCQRREHKRFSFSQSPRKLKFLWPKLRPQKTFFFAIIKKSQVSLSKAWT